MNLSAIKAYKEPIAQGSAVSLPKSALVNKSTDSEVSAKLNAKSGANKNSLRFLVCYLGRGGNEFCSFASRTAFWARRTRLLKTRNNATKHGKSKNCQ